MNPTCASCRFFKRRNVGQAMGTCHSRAPVVMFIGMANDANGQPLRNMHTGQYLANIDTFFPAVPDTEWCGDHTARLIKDVDLSKLEPEELKEA